MRCNHHCRGLPGRYPELFEKLPVLWRQTLCTIGRNPLNFSPKDVCTFRQKGYMSLKKQVCTFRRRRSVPLFERGLYLLPEEVCTFTKKVQTSLIEKYGGFGRKVQGVWTKSTGGLTEKYRGPENLPRGGVHVGRFFTWRLPGMMGSCARRPSRRCLGSAAKIREPR